jgi:hypothetical protein
MDSLQGNRHAQQSVGRERLSIPTRSRTPCSESTTADTTSAAVRYVINVTAAVDPNYNLAYVPGTHIVTSTLPLIEYLGAPSNADDIGSADCDTQDELQNDVRFTRNFNLLQIENRGIRFPPGAK